MSITEMVAVMLAYENEAKIERSDPFSSRSPDEWILDKNPSWNWSLFTYRVAEFPQ